MSKKTFAAVKAAAGELIVQVKDNQKYLCEKLNKATRLVKPIDSITTTEKNRNRIETRTVKLFDLKKHINCTKNWAGWGEFISGMVVVDRETELFDYANKTWKVVTQQSIYATSYVSNVLDIATRIRGHWGIESHNYVRDETMFEDYSRIRKNPQGFAILRSWVFNVLRFNGEQNIRAALYRNCCSFKNALNYFKL